MRWSSRAIWEEVNGASCVSLATRNLKTLSTLFTFEFHLLFRWCVFCEYYGGYSIVWRWIRNLSSSTGETGFFLYLHDWNDKKMKRKILSHEWNRCHFQRQKHCISCLLRFLWLFFQMHYITWRHMCSFHIVKITHFWYFHSVNKTSNENITFIGMN